MAKWLNRVAIAAPDNGTTAHTVSPTGTGGTVVSGTPFTPTAGNFLVCSANGSMTFSTPAGWTLPPNGSSINNSGLYVWHRTAAGGDQFATTHNGSGYQGLFEFFEFPAGSTFVAAAAAISVNPNGSEVGPTLTGLTGTNLVFGLFGQDNHQQITYSLTWTTGVEATDYSAANSPASGSDGYNYGSVYVEDYTGASFSDAAACTYTAATAERLVFAVHVAATGATVAAGATMAATATFGAAATASASRAAAVASIPGLAMWFRAYDLTVADGAFVTTWASAVGASTAAQATGTKQPTMHANWLNGKPAVRFDGTSDSLSLSGDALTIPSGASALTLVLIGSVNTVSASAGTATGLFLGAPSSAGTARATIARVNDSWRFASRRTNADTLASLVAAGADTSPHVHIGTVTYTTAAGALYRDGTVAASSAAFTTVGTAAAGTSLASAIGSAGPGNVEWWPGDIAEVMAFTTAISADDRAKVDAYITDTYGITTADYPAPGTQGSAAMAATASLTAGAVVQKPGAATLAATASMTAGATRQTPAQVSLAATASMTAGAARGTPGAAAMAATTSMTAGAAVTVLPQATMDATGTMTVGAVATARAAVTMTADTALSVAGAVAFDLRSTFIATATFTVGLRVRSVASIASLALWLRAYDLAVADGAVVTSWTSAVGASTASQATSTRQPTMHANWLNGKPAVRFDGTSDSLALSGEALTIPSAASALTLVLVGSINTVSTTAGTATGLFLGATSAAGIARATIARVNDTWRFATRRLNGDSLASLVSAGADTSPHVHVATVSYTATQGVLYRDGTATASSSTFTTAGVTTTGASLASAVGSAAPGNTEWWPGDIAEVLVFTSVLSVTDRAALDSYLTDTYGIATADYTAAGISYGTVELAATASMTAGGTPSRAGAVTMAATATMTPESGVVTHGAVGMAATASMTAGAVGGVPGAVVLAAEATYTPGAGAGTAAGASLAASATFTVRGTQGWSAAVALTATATLRVAGTTARPGSAAMDARATFTVAGDVVVPGAAIMRAVATLDVTGGVTLRAAWVAAARATLSVHGGAEAFAAASLDAHAALHAGAVVGRAAAVTFAAAAAMLTTPRVTVVAAVSMEAAGTMLATGLIPLLLRAIATMTVRYTEPIHRPGAGSVRPYLVGAGTISASPSSRAGGVTW